MNDTRAALVTVAYLALLLVNQADDNLLDRWPGTVAAMRDDLDSILGST